MKHGKHHEHGTVTITATKNTMLADGTFVAKGQQVEVTAEYADRLERERDNSFKK